MLHKFTENIKLICTTNVDGHLTKGKQYDSPEQHRMITGRLIIRNFVVIDDTGNKKIFGNKLFMTVKEHRKKQLQEIINPNRFEQLRKFLHQLIDRLYV